MNRILFLLKRREDYNAITHNHIGLSTGLYNSAKFVDNMLNRTIGFTSSLGVCIDANGIDREVTTHYPDICILEALWVTPAKLGELARLHPSVTWIVRLHSELPFMANEGIAMDWLGDYAKIDNVFIGINAPRMLREMQVYLGKDKTLYLPNYYTENLKPITGRDIELLKVKKQLDIACFGAIRPLKNHLVQAVAAIEFTEKIGKTVNFHINAGRVEMNGAPALNNLNGLFQQVYDRGHRLTVHQWTPQEQFLDLCAEMDIGMQVSFSETFNIVCADLVSQGVPVVGSAEIPWLSTHLAHPDPTDSDAIAKALKDAYNFPWLNVWLNQRSLKQYIRNTQKVWSKELNGLEKRNV